MVPWAGGWYTICGQHRGVYLSRPVIQLTEGAREFSVLPNNTIVVGRNGNQTL